MPEKYKFILEHTPFLVGAAGSVRVNYTRIIEMLIFAALTIFGSSYLTVNKLNYQMETMNKRVTVVEKTVDTLHPRGYPVPR